jgi:5-methylcytosine-specific restriction endonuclease McrA
MKCNQCHANKPDEEFVGLRGKPISMCSACSIRALAWRNSHREKVREYGKVYREENREKFEIYIKSYREQNRDKAKETTRLWRIANPERSRQLVSEWRAANPEYVKEMKRSWVKRNPEKARALWANRDARARGAEGKHTASDILWLYQQQAGRCEACRKKLIKKGKKKYHIDHMVPLSLGGNNYVSNLQLLCRSCNVRKNAMPYEEWCSKLGRLPFVVSKAS